MKQKIFTNFLMVFLPFFLFLFLSNICIGQNDITNGSNRTAYKDTVVRELTIIHHITIIDNQPLLKNDTIIHSDTIVHQSFVPVPVPTGLIRGSMEVPLVKDTNWFIQHHYYCMEYDTAQRHSVWVAYKFFDEYNVKNETRTDAWAFDPLIPKQYQSLNSTTQTFYEFGYDRGHLIASEDRVFNKLANEETFYFSNMSPQLSWFNQHIWKYLEESVRKWAQSSDCDTLYVVTGGAINEGVEVIGKLTTRNNVTVPKYYFKALLKRKGDSFDGIAFWLENKTHDTTKPNHTYSITIRELEEKTGIDFFPNLRFAVPDNPNLEDEVETTIDITKWKF